jgi:hypothetical protein
VGSWLSVGLRLCVCVCERERERKCVYNMYTTVCACENVCVQRVASDRTCVYVRLCEKCQRFKFEEKKSQAKGCL